MSQDLKAGLEFVAVGADKTLSTLIDMRVASIGEAIKEGHGYLVKHELEEMAKEIHKTTNLKFDKITLNKDCPARNAMCRFEVHGMHSGVLPYQYTHGQSRNVKEGKFSGELKNTVIDLEKVRVEGWLSEFTFQLTLNDGLWTSGDSVREIAAVIMHEIGHAFTVIATIGDYVWFDYYVLEGVDVILGKRKNTYNINALTVDYLAANVSDPKIKESLRNNPTEENIRQAVIAGIYTLPRPHLHTGAFKTSGRRSEQLADWFASRMGYGRELATMLDKMGGTETLFAKSRTGRVAIELMKVAGFLGMFTPLGMAFKVGSAALTELFMTVGIWSIFFGGVGYISSRDSYVSAITMYDRFPERLRKLRTDAVSQLRQVKDRDEARRLSEDIDAIDKILKQYHEWGTLFDLLAYVVSPSSRKESQRIKAEESLQRLMNNDLFVAGKRLTLS